MNWIELIPTWSDLVSSGVILTALAGIAYFFRDRISTFMDARIQHRFDAELEALKDDLAAKSRQIEDLRASALGVRAQRQEIIDRRRVEAVDQLWAAVKSLGQLRGACATMAIIRWPEAAIGAEKDPNGRRFFEDMSKTLPAQLPVHDAHASRPYISPIAWALFNAYQATLHYSYMQLKIIAAGAGPKFISGPESLANMLIVALPDWRERIGKFGQGVFPDAVQELKSRLLAELRRNLEGVEDDRAEVERAAQILELAAKAQKSDPKLNVPEELKI